MKTQRLFSILAVLFIFPTLSLGADRPGVPPGQPFQALLDQIDALKGQINALQAAANNTYVVYDATGKKVGTVIGVSEISSPILLAQTLQYPVVLIEHNNHRIPLIVAKDRFYSAYKLLHYTNADCTGQAYVSVSSFISGGATAQVVIDVPNPFSMAVVPFDSSVVYVENGAPIPASDVTLQSYKFGDHCILPSINLFHKSVVRVDPLVDLHTLFTPPFQVRR